MIWSAFFGVACLAALFVCHHAREERACLKVAAWTVLVNWALFAASWYPSVAPAFALDSIGIQVPPQDIWAITDLASLFVVMAVCRSCWWAPLLWSPYLICLCMYAVAWVNDLDYMDYRVVLDGSLFVQLAVLFMMGGGGCADYLLSRRGVRGLVLVARRIRRSPNETAR